MVDLEIQDATSVSEVRLDRLVEVVVADALKLILLGLLHRDALEDLLAVDVVVKTDIVRQGVDLARLLLTTVSLHEVRLESAAVGFVIRAFHLIHMFRQALLSLHNIDRVLRYRRQDKGAEVNVDGVSLVHERAPADVSLLRRSYPP